MENSKYEELIGQVLDGRYRIDALLGEGGMAAVMSAYDLKENRNVAVKMLKEEMTDDKQAVKRFINESKAIAAMNHPNIVKVYDVVVASDTKYLVMEYIEGESLRDYMDRNGAIPFDKTVSILSQILDALEHAHEKGVIHRDIKPQNIIMMKNGKVVVTDFGIAKMADSEATGDEKAMGTVYYISPEQAEGSSIDERSDLYSLGVTLFEMLTGKLPFTGENALDIAMKQINEEPPSPRDYLPTIPKGMEQIVLFALKKDPEERFQSASQMKIYLEELKRDPFAEFALEPKEQQRIALENAEKDRRKKEEEEKQLEEESKEPIVKYVRGDSWSVIPILLGIMLAFVMVLMVAGYYTVVNIFWDSQLNILKNTSGDTITIEDYVGKAFTEEMRAHLIDDLGYHAVTITEEFSETVPKGIVISQDPAVGEIRKQATVELKIILSKGSNANVLSFPDYSMQDYRIVRLLLEDQGYEVELQGLSNSAIDSCLIIRTYPAAGDNLPANNKVILYYSAGYNAQAMIFNFPEFIGMTEAEASGYIDTYNLNLVSVSYEYSDTIAAGYVCKCSVAAGPKPKLTPVSISISLGPNPGIY